MEVKHIQEYFSTNIDYHIRPMQNDFKAIKVDDILYPFKDGEKEVFVYGKGWIKVGAKKKHYPIPHLIDSTNVLEYIQEYGYRCLYFGIASKDINPNDCSSQNILNDLISFNKHGAKWIEFITRIRKMQNTVIEYYINQYKIYIDNRGCGSLQWIDLNNDRKLVDIHDLFQVRVNHYLFYPFKAENPSLCPIADDLKLIKTYNILRGHNVKHDFPISVKDRLTYFFGLEFALEYQKLMHFMSE